MKERISIFLLKITDKPFYPITKDSRFLSFLTYKAERIKAEVTNVVDFLS